MPDTIYKAAYATGGQAITCNIAGLANGGARSSSYIDNLGPKYLDVLVSLAVRSAAAGVSSLGYVNVFAYGTSNQGTDYTDGVTGLDAPFTVDLQTNLKLIGFINVNSVSKTFRGGPFSVANAFSGVLPERWGIVVQNQSGAGLDGAESNHRKVFQGVYATSVTA